MAGVKIVTEELEKDITLLKDVKATFVSLVRHGANRMPFRIVKTEKKGGDQGKMKRYAIQSILIPKGKTLEELSMEKGLEHLSEANVEQKQEFSDYDKYHQVPLEKFDSESMRLIKMGSSFAIIGELPDDVEGAILLGKEDVEKLAEIPLSPMNSIIGDPDVAAQQAMAARFRDLFETEIFAMMDVIHGTLKQSSTPIAQRKKTIVSAVDAFKQFITIALDAIGEQPAKIDKFELEGGNNEMELFKSKEEFTTAVTGIITEAFKVRDDTKAKADADAAKAADDEAAAAAAKADADANKSDDDKFAVIAKSVKDLSEKLEKMGDQLNTSPADDDQDDTDTNKDDGDQNADDQAAADVVKDTAYDKSKPGDKKKVIDKSVFGGLLTKKKIAA